MNYMRVSARRGCLWLCRRDLKSAEHSLKTRNKLIYRHAEGLA